MFIAATGVEMRILVAATAILACVCSAPILSDEVAQADSRTSGARPLNENETVLLDTKRGRILLRTKVVLRRGVLEMFVCPKGTKEHESILSVDAKAYVVHAGLLALGAKSGAPVSFSPKYTPPTGHEIEIFVSWKDANGKLHRRPAYEWIRHSIYRYYEMPMQQLPDGFKLPENDELRYDKYNKQILWFGPMTAEKRDELLVLSGDPGYQKAIRRFFELSQSRPMKADFIFAGSGFRTDETTGKRYYQAEGGDLICVANFPSATIDVSIESTADGDTLMFESWEERIPPRGTDVLVELVPVRSESKKSQEAADSTEATSGKPDSDSAAKTLKGGRE